MATSSADVLKPQVEDLLRELHSHVDPDAGRKSDEDAKMKAQQFEDLVSGVDTDSEKALVASVLLHRTTGLLRFLELSSDPDNSQVMVSVRACVGALVGRSHWSPHRTSASAGKSCSKRWRLLSGGPAPVSRTGPLRWLPVASKSIGQIARTA